MSERKRRCLFCGEPFEGQGKNFEHIVPRWLVVEADLKRRKMKVETRDRTFELGMGSIGMKACVRCNSLDSQLEGEAKAAYLAIKRGEEPSDFYAGRLLDWLDKMRVSLWLWLLENSKISVPIDPKFRVNDRLAKKDRIMLIRRYPEGAGMKGLALWGFGEQFLCMPSSMGMLINNIALVSVSADFFLTRHLCDLRIEVTHGRGMRDRYDLVEDRPNERRLNILGSPAIFGQCILPTDMFKDYGLPVAAESKAHKDISESPIYRLGDDLRQAPGSPAASPLFDGNIAANLVLMELNVARAARFIIEDSVQGDMSRINSERQGRVAGNLYQSLEDIEADIEHLQSDYRALTALSLTGLQTVKST